MSEMTTRERWTMGVGLLALAAFFLPWVYQSGFLSGPSIGLDLATTTESAASGMNLTALFITPVAALVIMALAVPAARRVLGRTVALVQIVLAIGGGVVPWLIVPEEISYWSGDVTYSYGLWLTMIALATVVGIAASRLFGTESIDVAARQKSHTPVG